MTLTCHFNARILFSARLDWIRLRGFRTQLRESEEPLIVRDRNVAQRLWFWRYESYVVISGSSLYKHV